jgi:hypothetical protein
MSVPARRDGLADQTRRRSARTVKIIEVDPVDRAEHAHRLHVDGQTWTTIAESVGFISAQVAQMAVTAYLQKAAVGRAPELRQAALATELDRLDALHATFWPLALEGDMQAANTVLKIIDRRMRLLRLDDASTEMGNVSRTILISGGDDMADQLREAALNDEREKVRRGGDDRFLRQLEGGAAPTS